MPKTKKIQDPDKKIVVSLKMTPKELRALKIQAKKYNDGNLSERFREAGLEYVPKKVKKTKTA